MMYTINSLRKIPNLHDSHELSDPPSIEHIEVEENEMR